MAEDGRPGRAARVDIGRLRRIGAGRGAGGSDRVARTLGVPALFAIGSATVGASIYFSLGLVAEDALGLTPVAFLLAGAFFVLTMLTYVEGTSLHAERGGASTFARHAFDELWSFVAGWAILLDYLIVMAIGALSISHYLAAFWGPAGRGGVEIAVAAVAIAWVVRANVRGLSAARIGLVLRVGLVNFALLGVVIVAGAALEGDLTAITGSIELGTAPTWSGFAFAAVIAAVALTGIEAASGLAGEIRVGREALRRVVLVGTAAVLVLSVGVSIVALMAVPVVDGRTELGGRFLEAPLLGVVTGWEPAWLGEAARYAVGGVAALTLLNALNAGMLGLSRLTYSLATNRQIPTGLGRLHARHATPHVAIGAAGVVVLVLVAASSVEFLAGLFAFGAMLSFAIAHVAVIALRFREPDLPRFRIAPSVTVRGVGVPLPAVAGAALAIAAWVSVLVLHDGALIAGTAWMVAGLTLYVVYRRAQGQSVTERHTVSPRALQEVPEIEYGSLLVPVFGGPLDDDIVGTAGRLAAAAGEEGEGEATIDAIYVIELPMALPLDARVPEERVAAARRALARAKEVGEEYENVKVETATVRARTVGGAIVDEARRRGVEAIVLAAEEPSRVRGGALLGGRGAPRDRFAGETTRHVIEKAPCRVIMTAAPAGEEGERGGVKP